MIASQVFVEARSARTTRLGFFFLPFCVNFVHERMPGFWLRPARLALLASIPFLFPRCVNFVHDCWRARAVASLQRWRRSPVKAPCLRLWFRGGVARAVLGICPRRLRRILRMPFA